MNQMAYGNGRTIRARVDSRKVNLGLLQAGVLAGPLYILVGVLQMHFREGFDIRKHELSLMSIGPYGWLQIANFLLSGMMVIACGVGLRKVLRSVKGGTWGPVLLCGYGLGLIGAGLFVADPAAGFPVGMPETNMISWHGLLHFVTGAIGFLCLIGSCIVFARRFLKQGSRGWAIYSVATGVLFFAAFAGIASGSKSEWLNLAFTVAVVLGWTWISLIAFRFSRNGGDLA
mgnify:CR=1 FL=1